MVNYKHQYEQVKKMLSMYQDKIVPGMRAKIEELESNLKALESTPHTNGDRIRHMSNEELAAFFCHELRMECYKCLASDKCYAGHNGILDWLNQPAEGR